uniref:tetratricopeptide repeat protein 1-like isoform X1 n=2 Tax=Myxine glutinosa TaxID=7769 RepID=UPI00358FE2E2
MEVMEKPGEVQMEARDQASDASATEVIKHKSTASDEEEFYDCLGDNYSVVKSESSEMAHGLKEDTPQGKTSAEDGECHPQCTAGDEADDVCGLSEMIKDVNMLDARTAENMTEESQYEEHEPLSDAKKEEQEEEEKRRVESALTDEEKEELRVEALKIKGEGNEEFKAGANSEAVRLYSKALSVCPLSASTERAILFANRAAALSRMEQTEAAIVDCTKALELNQSYMRARLRRAELQEKANKLDEALADYKEALTLDPNLGHARIAVQSLTERINERNDQMKKEMFDKLRELGDMTLRPFGLSTRNFQMQQDPKSGGYSVSFVQTPKD